MGNTLQISANKRNVVIAGAGFSKSVGLPLQNELLAAVVPRNAIDVYNYALQRDLDAPVDVEEFLSLYDFETQFLKGRSRSDGPSTQAYLSGFFACVAQGIANIALLPSKVKGSFWRITSQLVDLCESFITTNWDTLIELQIRAMEYPLRFRGRDNTCKLILKLHGSIDWFRRSSAVNQIYHPDLFAPVLPGYVRCRPFSKMDGFFKFPKRIHRFLKEVPPAIIGPTHFKAIPTAGFRDIWRTASDVLLKAEHVIIIGFSLPVSDVLMRCLLTSGLGIGLRTDPKTLRVTVVDPDPTGQVRERYDRLFGQAYEFLQCSFLELEIESSVRHAQ